MSSTKNLNAAELKAAVLGALLDLLAEWLPDGEVRGDQYVALNPNRSDRNLGSFQIDLATGTWRDYAIDVGGSDAISLYAYLFNQGEYGAAAAELRKSELVLDVHTGVFAPTPAKVARRLNRNAANQARAEKLYQAAVNLTNTPAERYLESRGLRRVAAWDRLRVSKLHYPGKGPHPVLIAPIEAPDGTLAGVHRTYLQPSGKKLSVRDPKRTLGQVRGNAIHLGAVADELIICEGLEDGLTLHQELELPVWVACGASSLHSMVIPAQVRSLVIAADNDPAGEMAAYRAADAMAVLGRRVGIIRPASGFKDFNDELCGVRHD
jgi:DNA primase